MFKELRDYYQDNPEGYWFKRKLYGWGWVPVKWQGWAVVAGWALLVTAFSLTIDPTSPAREVGFTFLLPLVILTALLIRICYKKGEAPRWQWGLPKKSSKE